MDHIIFYSRVSQCSQVNQMHARNIATCLFPTFFPPDASNFSPATFNTDSCIFIDILVLLIGQGEYIFPMFSVILAILSPKRKVITTYSPTKKNTEIQFLEMTLYW